MKLRLKFITKIILIIILEPNILPTDGHQDGTGNNKDVETQGLVTRLNKLLNV